MKFFSKSNTSLIGGFMFHIHCWHMIGDRIKIKGSSTCKKSNPYIHTVFGSTCVRYKYTSECCKCGKKKEELGFDYDIQRGLNYPSEEE